MVKNFALIFCITMLNGVIAQYSDLDESGLYGKVKSVRTIYYEVKEHEYHPHGVLNDTIRHTYRTFNSNGMLDSNYSCVTLNLTEFRKSEFYLSFDTQLDSLGRRNLALIKSAHIINDTGYTVSSQRYEFVWVNNFEYTESVYDQETGKKISNSHCVLDSNYLLSRVDYFGYFDDSDTSNYELITTYERNENGQVIRSTELQPHESNETVQFTYSYKEFDSKGNPTLLITTVADDNERITVTVKEYTYYD